MNGLSKTEIINPEIHKCLFDSLSDHVVSRKLNTRVLKNINLVTNFCPILIGHSINWTVGLFSSPKQCPGVEVHQYFSANRADNSVPKTTVLNTHICLGSAQKSPGPPAVLGLTLGTVPMVHIFSSTAL